MELSGVWPCGNLNLPANLACCRSVFIFMLRLVGLDRIVPEVLGVAAAPRDRVEIRLVGLAEAPRKEPEDTPDISVVAPLIPLPTFLIVFLFGLMGGAPRRTFWTEGTEAVAWTTSSSSLGVGPMENLPSRLGRLVVVPSAPSMLVGLTGFVFDPKIRDIAPSLSSESVSSAISGSSSLWCRGDPSRSLVLCS